MRDGVGGGRKEGEKIENQNEKDFINRAGDPWLFIHKVTKEDFGTECPAKSPISMTCLFEPHRLLSITNPPLFLPLSPSLPHIQTCT